MKENKIDFIICYSDQKCLDKCISCIENLIVPDGFEMDILGASEADSLSEAYNAIMKESEAKYKVYLYENIYITNNYFLIDALRCFEKNPTLGMIGTIGQSIGDKQYGVWDCGAINIINDSRAEKIKENNELEGMFVERLYGGLLMTSTDIEWGALTEGRNGYCDIDHSVKMQQSGYKMMVPYQEEPWCIFEAGKSLYERYDVFTAERGCKYIMPQNVNNKPLVSVLLCVYNGEEFVAKTLESIIAQTYQNLQIVVVDDCSTDNSRGVIGRYAERDSRIETVFLNKNGNVCNSANEGYKRCKGKYVASIGHDDVWAPEKIQRQLDFMELYNDVAVCFSWVDIINQNDEIISKSDGAGMYDLFSKPNFSRSEWIDILFYGNNCLCAPSSMIRKECIKGDLYKYSLLQLQDFDLWLRIVSEYEMYIIQDRLMNYRMFIGEERNLSSFSREKKNRLWHESGYLRTKFIKDMDDKLFVELFRDHLIDKEVKKHNEILCEKMFVLKDIKCCRCYDGFMELFDNSETRSVLEDKYNFSLNDFYEFNKTSMVFDSELLYMVIDLKEQLNSLMEAKR